MFGKALQQAQLDYSDKSLWRLDQLLTQIQERAKPSREKVQDTLEGRNFCSLIAYYLIELVSRRTGASFDWHDRASALDALPIGSQLPDDGFARLVSMAPDQGAAFLPLGWLEARLLGDGPQLSADDYVNSLVAQVERNGPVVWWTGMHALGRMASWQMMMAADGGMVWPVRLTSKAPNSWISSAFSGRDVGEVLESGGRILEENPEGTAWQVFSYDGVADLKSGPSDAIMVLLYTYGPSPMKLKIAFPYRPAKAGGPFAILDPRLLGANLEDAQIERLNGALEQGIQSIKWPFGTSWDQLRAAG
ncbi:hypothetical protein ASD07_19605 [Duganella sp. Root336D2]|nr:hypothetical protein ASD07_19605 [Duganella sp. Root336D2]